MSKLMKTLDKTRNHFYLLRRSCIKYMIMDCTAIPSLKFHNFYLEWSHGSRIRIGGSKWFMNTVLLRYSLNGDVHNLGHVRKGIHPISKGKEELHKLLMNYYRRLVSTIIEINGSMVVVQVAQNKIYFSIQSLTTRIQIVPNVPLHIKSRQYSIFLGVWSPMLSERISQTP